MKREKIRVGNVEIPVIVLDCAVVGSGCAGFNAADWLYDLGRRDVAVLTEGVNMGTSRNAGSDKQTYYKLSLASDGEDSIARMARDLFECGGVDGDNALAEAACSVRSFIKLANLGVPFPTNEYGEYVGYKTDHDPRQRATSAGPLTSRVMTECLERSVRRKNIPVLDGLTAVKILTRGGAAEGLLCLDGASLGGPSLGICVVRARRIILATGGPAGCYRISVYPESQTGMSGMALEAGAKGTNLQEWQYGLASTDFRWNVSGTYQQVLPKYVSAEKGGAEREFLPEYFGCSCGALDMEFLKGYQWPFDAARVRGSSMVDLIVYCETCRRGREVFLDFRSDPSGLENGFGGLGKEAFGYLKNSHALLKTPLARLEKMNPQAVELYARNGIDLRREPLRVAVCAQHHNGGIAVDRDWQTCVHGLYAAGEAAGTFGVRRPGGSALNSSQVGSMRAAQHIACTTEPDAGFPEDFAELARSEAADLLRNLKSVLDRPVGGAGTLALRAETQEKMSLCAAQIRDVGKMEKLEEELQGILRDFYRDARIAGHQDIPALLKSRDIFVTQLAVLSAMRLSAETVGSRGSALVLQEDGEAVGDGLPGLRFRPELPLRENMAATTECARGGFVSRFERVRDLPCPDNWFENVWGEYRQRTERISKKMFSE